MATAPPPESMPLMTYPPQQPDEASSEDTQSLRAREQEQPVSPFGPAPDPHQQGRPPQPPPVPVDPFAPQPQAPQYPPQQYHQQVPVVAQPQYPAQPQPPVGEPPTVPNQFTPPAYPPAPQAQQPQVYAPTPDAHAPYAPPQQPQPQPPVSAPPAYVPPQPPVSGPPAYTPPQPPTYTPPQAQPSPYAPPPVSAPPAHTPPPVSAPPAQPPVSAPPVYTPPPVSAPPAYTPPPVSAPPVSAPPVSGVPVSGTPTSGPPVYVPQQPIYVPQSQHVDPSAFAPKPVDTQGPTYTGLAPEPQPQPQPQPWGGAPVRERRGMPRWLLVTGIVVLVLALAGGAYLFVRADKGGTPQADPTPTQSATPPAPQLTPVTSPGTRLEYLTAGAPWALLAAPPAGINEISGPVGETKASTPVPAIFVVGGLDTALVPYAGTAKMGETASALAESLDGRRYVGGDNKPLPGLKREAAPTVQQLRLDGRTALILRYHVTWDGGGDQVTIVVADMDGARAAVMYAAVPDTEQALQATVADRVMSLHFNL